jgi:hypothetical protein
VHPGANFVENGSTGMKRYLKYGNREQVGITALHGHTD